MPIAYINELNNRIKLITGAVALVAGVDVDNSVNSAIFAAENNGYNKSAEAVVLDESVLRVYAAITGIILKPVIVADFYSKYNSATTDAQREKLLVEAGLSLVVSKALASKFLKFKACFVAGTLIETIDGLKAIETIQQGDLVWSRHEETLEYGYRPVVDTVSFDNKEVYEVVVQNNHGKLETYQTTEEHPFWVVDTGWLPASLLQTGMTLVNRDNKAVLTVVSQAKLDKTDTVYNFEVEEFHTYHIGEFGTWVNNADCLNLYNGIKNAPKYPVGFKDIPNGQKSVNVNNLSLLSDLRLQEPGKWKKVYRDGYDKAGNKVSIHYFQSQSGKVFDVKVKDYWSN